MALIKCPECKTQISSKAVACPQCGLPLKGNARKRKPVGCCGVITLGFFGLFALGLIASLSNPGGTNRSNPGLNGPNAVTRPVSNATPRVPRPGAVPGDKDRVFEAAQAQRGKGAPSEEGDAKDIAQIKAVYVGQRLGLPVRIVAIQDWANGFRYIVVTSNNAAHVAYLATDGEVTSIKEVYDSQGTPKGLAELYRKQK